MGKSPISKRQKAESKEAEGRGSQRRKKMRE
jgi:hypothetical protein